MNLYYHFSLASYYNSKLLYLDEPTRKKPNNRKLVELPWQQTTGEMWDEVTNTLCNLDFIQAKAAAKMTYQLVNDFNTVLEVIPDNAETNRKEKERQVRMEKYTQDLMALAKGEITIEMFEIPESIIPWSAIETEEEINRIKNTPNKADTLKDFLNFLGQDASILQNFAYQWTHLTTQQAWNYSDIGPVYNSVNDKLSASIKNLLLPSQFIRKNWNPKPQIIKILRGHFTSVNAVAIIPSGNIAITGSEDGRCIVYDLITGNIFRILDCYNSPGNRIISLQSVTITPDVKMATAYCGSFLRWDLASGKLIDEIKKSSNSNNSLNSQSYRNKSTSLLDQHILFYPKLHQIKIFDIKEGLYMERKGFFITSVAIIPDGSKAVFGSDDKAILYWDIAQSGVISKLKAHTKTVTSVAITPDGKFALSGSLDQNCILWNIKSGEIKLLKGHNSEIWAVSITPNGMQAISGAQDGTCILWDLLNGEIIKHLKGNNNCIKAVDITPNGKLAISGSDNGLCILWDLHSSKQIKILQGHTRSINSVAITPDGKMAISGSSDNLSFLWDLESGSNSKIIEEYSPICTITATLNGKKAVSGSWNNCILWDLKSLTKISTLFCQNHAVFSIAITPDGKRAISGSFDTTIILWDLKSGQPLNILKEHSGIIYSLALSADGKMMLSGSGDKKCILWNLNTLQPIFILNKNTNDVKGVYIIPDGKRAVSVSKDGIVILWNLVIGKEIRTFLFNSEFLGIIAITADGKRVLSSSYDNTYLFWNLATGEVILRFKGHEAEIRTIKIGPDGKRAICNYRDGAIIIWDLEKGEKIALYLSTSKDTNISLYPGGILVGESTNKIFTIRCNRKLLCPEIPQVTACQIWDFEIQQYQALSADCPLCGNRFAPPLSVLVTIEEITRKVGLKPEQSPCLELPDDAWEDPGLLGNCPNCGEALKFNPFITGGD